MTVQAIVHKQLGAVLKGHLIVGFVGRFVPFNAAFVGKAANSSKSQTKTE
jgi:hypothetical protein